MNRHVMSRVRKQNWLELVRAPHRKSTLSGMAMELDCSAKPPMVEEPTKTKTTNTAVAQDESMAAISILEEGLGRSRVGDLLGAELAWTRTLGFEPNHRSAIANLKLLKKRREMRRG